MKNIKIQTDADTLKIIIMACVTNYNKLLEQYNGQNPLSLLAIALAAYEWAFENAKKCKANGKVNIKANMSQALGISIAIGYYERHPLADAVMRELQEQVHKTLLSARQAYFHQPSELLPHG